MVDVQLPGHWKEWTSVSFIAASGTQAKILCDVAPAQVDAAIPSETPLPNGESAVRQRVLTGGQRVIDGAITSTDGTARSVLIYIGTLLTLFAAMGVPTVTATNAINRTVGSFITDGWLVGDSAMGFGFATAGNNGLMLVITGVSAGTLTVNGTPLTNETIPAGFRLFRVALKTRRAVPLTAGSADAVPPVVLLGGTQDPSAMPAPDTGVGLSASGALIVAMVAAVSALPAQVQVHAISALY